MLSNLTGLHAVVILAVVLLIFGAAKLPALARSVGQSVRILKDEAAEQPRTEQPRLAAQDRSEMRDADVPAAASAPRTSTSA